MVRLVPGPLTCFARQYAYHVLDPCISGWLNAKPKLNRRCRRPGLRSLDLHGNKLTRVDGLQTLHSLRELILDHNILKYLDAGCFASVPRLRRLHLGHNGLRSLAHLSNLTRLQFLHIGSNRITEITELDRLTNLVSLTEVWLVDNLVAKKQWYRALLLSKCRQLKVSSVQMVTHFTITGTHLL